MADRLPPRVGHVFRLAGIICDAMAEVDGEVIDPITLALQILNHPHSQWGPVANPARYHFAVRTFDGLTVASGDGPTLEEVEREGRRYLAQYQQDGPHFLRVGAEYTILEVSND